MRSRPPGVPVIIILPTQISLLLIVPVALAPAWTAQKYSEHIERVVAHAPNVPPFHELTG